MYIHREDVHSDLSEPSKVRPFFLAMHIACSLGQKTSAAQLISRARNRVDLTPCFDHDGEGQLQTGPGLEAHWF